MADSTEGTHQSSITGDARISLGLVWFVVVMAVLWVDLALFAVVLGVLAGVAGWQSTARMGSVKLLAGAVATVSVLSAGLDPRVAGALVLAGVVGTVVLAVVGADTRSPAVARVGVLLAGWVPPVVGACSVVAVARVELGSAVVLMWAMAIGDAGTYLVGYGAARRWVGPLAGAVGIVAVLHMSVQLGIPPLDPATVASHSLALAVALPLGPVVCRALVPAPGRALRRLDALVVAGPLWWLLVERLMG